MSPTCRTLVAALVALAAAALEARSSVAAVPTTVAVQGALVAAGGGPAADGNYIALFRLYDVQTGGSAAWFEGPLDLVVKGGAFSYALGSKTPLTPALVAAMPQVWLGVQVGLDPELPRVPLHSAVFAVRAASAEALDCSACIGATQLDPKAMAAYAKTADVGAALAGYAKVADLANYAQKADLGAFVQSAALAKVAGTGDYADLKGTPKLADVATTGQYLDLIGLPVLAKVGAACGTGLVVRGIKGDGGLDCVSAAVLAKDLPADGLDEVSNGLLTTQFTEWVAPPAGPVKLPDNQAVGVNDTLTVPEFGSATGLAFAITVTNSDVSKVRVTLFDPGGNKAVVYNGDKAGTKLELAIQTPGAAILDGWVGKSPAGVWSINVADLAAGPGGTDGQVDAWSIAVKTLSSAKVAAKGAFQFHIAAAPPVPCNPSNLGSAYVNQNSKALLVCDGKDWAPLAQLGPVGTKDNPAQSCKDIQIKTPTAPDGAYWVSGDGSPAAQVWCDMTTDGGGWTLAMRFKNDGTFGYASSYWQDKKLLNEDPAGSVQPTLNANAKLGSWNTVVGSTVRGCKGAGGSGQCFTQAMGGSKTLTTLFNEGYKAGGPSRGLLTSLWGDDGSQPHCNASGINNAASSGGAGTYSAARWGLVGNNENDCATTDSGWGFGVYGCSDTGKACGAGAWFWQSGGCGSNCTQGTIWVR